MKYELDVLDVCLNNILNGFSPLVFEEQLFLAKHPTSNEIFEANAFALLKKKELESLGVPTDYAILKSCIEKGLWSYQKDQEVINIEKTIRIKQETVEKIVMPSQADALRGEINGLKKKLAEIKSEKQKLLVNSLEYKAVIEKRDYLIYLGIYNPDKTRFWADYKSYSETEASFVEKISDDYYNTIGDINHFIVRAVARETDARYRLKNFALPNIKDVSVIMMELKQWCDFYNSIYDLPDKPSQDIISDDDKLDKWLIARKLKHETEKSVNLSKGGDGKGFTGIVGTKEDLELLGGADSNTVIKIAQGNGK